MLRCRRRRRPFDSTAFRSSATLWTATVRDGAIADVRSRSRSLARAFTAPVCLTPRPLPRSPAHPSSHRAGLQHQLKRYYIYGTVEDCRDRWAHFTTCVTLKLKPPEEAQVRVECVALLVAHAAEPAQWPASRDACDARVATATVRRVPGPAEQGEPGGRALALAAPLGAAARLPAGTMSPADGVVLVVAACPMPTSYRFV